MIRDNFVKAEDSYREHHIPGRFVGAVPCRPTLEGHYQEVAFFQEKDGVTFYRFSEKNGFIFPHKARDLASAMSKAECMGLFEGRSEGYHNKKFYKSPEWKASSAQPQNKPFDFVE